MVTADFAMYAPKSAHTAALDRLCEHGVLTALSKRVCCSVARFELCELCCGGDKDVNRDRYVKR